MASVTERISQIRQPYGGYVPPHRSSVTKMKDNRKLNYFENIDHKIMESAVDCLIRYGTGCSAQEAFTAPLNGAALVRDSANARDLLHSIRGLNDKAIKAACKRDMISSARLEPHTTIPFAKSTPMKRQSAILREWSTEDLLSGMNTDLS